MKLEIHHFHHPDNSTQQILNELLTIVTQNQSILKELKVTDQEVSTLLDQVNATTNGIADVQKADSTVLGTVKTELEALLATAGQPGGISDATAAKLQQMATAITGVKTNADSNSALLNQIAAEGQPVVPPPPPPPPAG
jgi:hypothetical protein